MKGGGDGGVKKSWGECFNQTERIRGVLLGYF